MADDERLREALLELQVLRDREVAAHAETSALLAALEAHASAPDPGAAIDALIAAMGQGAGATRVLVVERCPHESAAAEPGPPMARVAHSTEAPDVGTRLHPPVDLFARARNIADQSALPPWRGEIGLSRSDSVLSVPLPSQAGLADGALVAFAPGAGAFSRADMRFLRRLSGLVASALAAEKLAADHALLAAVIEGSSSGFAIADAACADEPLVYVNRAFEQITGWTAAEVLGHNCRLLSDEPKASPERARLRAAVAARAEGRFLLRNRRRDGTPFWNDLTLFPVRDGAGRVTHMVATQTDVSSRVEAERERDRLRQRMTQALAVTEDSFLVVGGPGDAAGRVLLANDSLARSFPAPGPGWAMGTGYGENRDAHAAALPQRSGYDLLPDLATLSDWAQDGRGHGLALADGRSFLLRARRDADGNLVVTATNITRLKAAEALLRQRAAAIEAAFDGILLVDAAERIRDLNRAAARLLGHDDADTARGADWRAGYAAPPPLTAGAHHLSRPEAPGGPRTHEVTRSPLEEGGAVLILRDITERLAEEERQEQLKLALARAQRQEAVSQLASGVAHDFNNLLSAIHGSATLIRMAPDTAASAHEHADRILRAGQRASKLVNRLLDIGAEPRGDTSFELRSALSDLPAMIGGTLPEAVSFDMGLPEEMIVLEGDAGTLNQIVLNLVLNAVDAMPEGGGRIEVSAALVEPDRPLELAQGMLSAGRRYACIRVADTGAGIAPATQARIFAPHFTTKGARGTGLGLAMVALQTRAAGGGVDVESRPGAGTTFTVYWPARALCPPGAEDAAPAPEADLSGMTVLVVDDDVQVGEVLHAYLESCGAEVAFCEAPDIAAEAIESDPESWSALVTDYDMPGLSGGALIERIRPAAPDLPVFLVTALARRITDPRVQPGRVHAVIAKPVDLGDLARRLAQLRGARDTGAKDKGTRDDPASAR